jgi:beta-lactamase regulating signal transducer with metallopeptidase domain
MDDQEIFLISFLVWLICAFVPIVYIAKKIKPEDLEDDNDPRTWFYWGKDGE